MSRGEGQPDTDPDPAVSRRSESWQPPLPQWSNAQISEHYSTCIKLSTENVSGAAAFGG